MLTLTLNKKINATKTAISKSLMTQSLLLMSIWLAMPLSAAASSVSVSNYPLFLLSNEVTKGAPGATRLLEPGDVGHHGSLSPSDMKTIENSKFVVWFGESLERNLAQTLNSAPNSIALLNFKAFARQNMRDVTAQPLNVEDPHIWLDPENAKAITRALAVIHSHANPKYADLYRANVADFAKRMDAAVNSVKTHHPLPVGVKPKYWAYHDAYQYLEPALNISLAGTLTTDHHLPPKASQFVWLKQNRPNKSMCLVAQGEVAKGVYSKLAPINVTIQAEDMSMTDSAKSPDFVWAWQGIASGILKCMAG